MRNIIETKNLGKDTNGKVVMWVKMECDTLSDLPAIDAYSTSANIVLALGSEAHVIDPNSKYQMKSDGTWIIQDVGNDYYSKSEIDDKLQVIDELDDMQDRALAELYGETANLSVDKQDKLVLGTNFDSNPTSGSNYPVRSGGVVNYTFGAAADTIPTGANLNNYIDPGSYRCETNTIAASLLNCPTANGFRLEVKSTIASSATGYQLQFIYPNNANGEFFMRRRGSASSGTWSSWFKFQGTAV